MNYKLSAALIGAVLLAAPAAFADPARDDLIRAEAQLGAINAADAAVAAPANFKEAQLRLEESRVAEDKNDDEDSQWRSAEAMLQTEIVQEKIKLQSLQRTVSEIEGQIETLSLELKS